MLPIAPVASVVTSLRETRLRSWRGCKSPLTTAPPRDVVICMASLKRSEMRFIDEVFDMGSGYVLDFSNRTFAEFFEDEFRINIYQEKYQSRGTSKANHLRGFIDVEDGHLVGKVLRKLWDYRTQSIVAADAARALPDSLQTRFFDLVAKIEAGSSPPVLGSLSGAAEILDFDTVSRDLERALASAKDDPEDAVTAACSTVESDPDRACAGFAGEEGHQGPVRGRAEAARAVFQPDRSCSPDRRRCPQNPQRACNGGGRHRRAAHAWRRMDANAAMRGSTGASRALPFTRPARSRSS